MPPEYRTARRLVKPLALSFGTVYAAGIKEGEMEIKAEGDTVVITLEPEEFSGVEIDHGEGELCIPIDDTLGTLEEFSAACKEARRYGP
jgi:hypothetical protein